MNRAQQIIDRLLGAGPAPTIAPPKPGTRPTTTPSRPAPRPGTRPWNPSIRPGVNPRPKARSEEERSFAEAIPVPPPPADEEDDTTAKPEALPMRRKLNVRPEVRGPELGQTRAPVGPQPNLSRQGYGL